MKNPLLDFDNLPRFDLITHEHVTPAMSELLAHCREVVRQMELPAESVSWDDFVVPLENATEKLSRAWGAVRHMNAVIDTPELRAVYNENLPAITEFWTALSQNLTLFDKYRQLQKHSEFETLSAARKKVIENALRDFRLGGAELPEDKKPVFAETVEKLAQLTTRFSENVLDATDAYSYFTDDISELAGLPADALNLAQAAAQKDGKTGYRLTLHFPSYFPVMQFAENRELRKKMYDAYVTRASELGENPEWDNTPLISEILRLRHSKARLLNYASYAEVSLVPKMAQTADQVISFMQDLANRARPFAERDMKELAAFAKETLGIDDLSAFDIPYASEKLRQLRYDFSEQEVKAYFPERRVMDGIFHLIEQLFGVFIKTDSAPVWHEDVRFYRVEKNGQLIGHFYLDLYARPGKRGGAWMDDVRSRRRTGDAVQTPAAYLVCNFTEPVQKNAEQKMAYFTHDEVITLFHEFGHGLHHILTAIDDLGVSGIAGVEWDAVELPSQFMENFCWEFDVLRNMTAHETTGEPLPRELFDRMYAARNFHSGLQMLRQVEFALIDMHLHYDFDPEGSKTAQERLDEVRKQYAVVIPPGYNRFLHAFKHIFAGGYAAGYYSYKWAEVLSADVYSAFEEESINGSTVISGALGSRLLDEILAVGGSRPAMDSFEAFRGRKPAIDALLRHNGLTES